MKADTPADLTSLSNTHKRQSTLRRTPIHRVLQRPGCDLSRITFPTFVLEPRSMLERITDFLSHPDLIFGYVSAVLPSIRVMDGSPLDDDANGLERAGWCIQSWPD